MKKRLNVQKNIIELILDKYVNMEEGKITIKKGVVGLTNDFYCDEVLNGKTEVKKVYETDNTLAYYHTKPYYRVHIVAIPKKHIPSLTEMEEKDHNVFYELMGTVRKVARDVEKEYGACRVITNVGQYQDSKHLHFHIASGENIK
jgi:histidine triad (HIT) family protein